MAQIPFVPVAFFILMLIAALALGVYLITTNPPKDGSAFVGIGKKKLSSEEVDRRRNRD